MKPKIESFGIGPILQFGPSQEQGSNFKIEPNLELRVSDLVQFYKIKFVRN